VVVVVVVMIELMAASIRPVESGAMNPTAGVRTNDMAPKLASRPGDVNTRFGHPYVQMHAPESRPVMISAGLDIPAAASADPET